MKRQKKARLGPPEPSIDVLFYNQILDELRYIQDSGSAYFGSFVYQPKPVPPELYGQWHAPLLAHVSGKQNSQTLISDSVTGSKITPGRQGKRSFSHVQGNVGDERRQLGFDTSASVDKKNGFVPGKSPGTGLGLVSGSRLGSLNHVASERGRFRGDRETVEKEGGNPGVESSSHFGKEEDFPAAWRAVEFIRRFREKLGARMLSSEWKQIMINVLLKESAKDRTGDKLGSFTVEEDASLLVARYVYGNRWQLVEKAIAGRSATAIKRHWHSTLRDRYRRAGWCSELLAPPVEFASSAQKQTLDDDDEAGQFEDSVSPLENYLQKKTERLSSGVRQDRGKGGESSDGDRDEEDEDMESAEEDDQASIQEDVAELEAARLSTSPGVYKRVLHMQYLRHLAACEATCREQGVWEDVCFICNTAAGQMVSCQWGKNGIGGEIASLQPCWKACHIQCLNPGIAPLNRQFWTCPRHQCVGGGGGVRGVTGGVGGGGDNCQAMPKFSCRSCPKSYCVSHLQNGIKDAEPVYQSSLSGSYSKTIVCLSCQEVERAIVQQRLLEPRVQQQQKQNQQ